MSAVVIRAMSVQDYDAVVALWQACPGVGLSSADSQESIARYLARNPGLSFVAENEEQLMGAVLSGHDGRRGYVHHLAVHPAYRRQGMGRALGGRCLAALADAGIQKCHLYVFAANQGGVAFWQNTGWTLRDDLFMMSYYTNNE